MKLWQKDYALNKQIEAFTAGDDVVLDQKLAKYDCLASIAHANMLAKIGVLKDKEARKLVEELRHIIELDARGAFKIRPEQEDCHTAIENHLTEALGDLGAKIHTGRSRNDQVLTALRLFYKEELAACKELVVELKTRVEQFIEKYGEVQFPGYTHTRKAMPSTMALWGQALADALTDDLRILDLALELMDQSPLGTGAGYGVPLAVDREFAARELGFAKVQKNPIYAQNSRGKFETTLLHALTQILFDLNKTATDLIFFSMPELGYVELPAEFCTGSSIMPHKKNPDVLELVRAKYHQVVAYELQLKSMLANLISGYHRDVQLSKEPVMKGLEVTRSCVSIMTLIFEHLTVNKTRCEQALTRELFATEEVYELVKQGVPFREAYRRVSAKYERP